jgi:hypothetical protein
LILQKRNQQLKKASQRAEGDVPNSVPNGIAKNKIILYMDWGARREYQLTLLCVFSFFLLVPVFCVVSMF